MAGHLGTATPKTMAQAPIAVTLRSGESQVIPGGDWFVNPGIYSTIQYYDAIRQGWVNYQSGGSAHTNMVSSDGWNYRIFNPTGTVVGGVVTNGGTANTAKNGVWPAGSSSVSGVTVTTTAGANAPAGTQLFNAIVGGDGQYCRYRYGRRRELCLATVGYVQQSRTGRLGRYRLRRTDHGRCIEHRSDQSGCGLRFRPDHYAHASSW